LFSTHTHFDIYRFELSDATYIRFLKARDFNVVKAQKMLGDHLEFRKKHRPHEINEHEPQMREFLNSKVWRLIGLSKNKSPIALTTAVLFDAADVKDELAFERYIVLTAELCAREMTKTGFQSDLGLYVLFSWEESYVPPVQQRL
jgi:hypothetical protein